MIIPITALLFLIYFTYQDLKRQEINNLPIVIFFFIGLFFAWTDKQLIHIIFFQLILGSVFLYSWTKKQIGGADVKIFIALIPFILIGQINIYSTMIIYLFILSFTSLFYGQFYKMLYKKDKKINIPFLPLITFSYLLISIYEILK